MPHYSYYYSLNNSNSFIKPIQYSLITGSDEKPITLEQVKDFIRIDQDDDSLDVQLALLIDTATNAAEQITGRDLLIKTYKTYLDDFPISDFTGIQIQKSKLQVITSIQYLVAGVLTTFDSSNYYITDKQEYATINLDIENNKTWPTNVDNRKQAVEIIFTAGFGSDPCDVPANLKRAMLAHVNILNHNLGDCKDETAISKQISQLYLPYMVSRKLFCGV